MKIVQISDTHLSPTKRHFNGNWEPLVDWIAEQKADFVVHTGDLSMDGAGHREDLAFSRDCLAAIDVPVLVVPGNHDVGHFHSAQPVDETRLARWRDEIGPDRWSHDHGDWRLVGLNALLLGLGDDREAEQFDWLSRTLETRGHRRVAVFAHKPLFLDAPDEGETGYWGVPPLPRRRLIDLFAAHDVALYGSGHVHRAWTDSAGATSLVWAPASSFVVGALAGRDMPGEQIVGAAVHIFGADVTSQLETVPGLELGFIDDVIEEIYPTVQPEAAQ